MKAKYRHLLRLINYNKYLLRREVAPFCPGGLQINVRSDSFVFFVSFVRRLHLFVYLCQYVCVVRQIVQ